MSRLSLGLGFAFGVAALAPAAIAPAAKAAFPERPITVAVERIPTGYDFVFSIWNAMFVPKGTPEPILAGCLPRDTGGRQGPGHCQMT